MILDLSFEAVNDMAEIGLIEGQKAVGDLVDGDFYDNTLYA